MADREKSFDRTGWNDVRLKDARRALENILPARTPAQTDITPFRHTPWSHVRWACLIAAMTLSAGYAISRYLTERAGQQDISTVLPATHAFVLAPASAPAEEDRQRLRRKLDNILHPTITAADRAFFARVLPTMHNGTFRCIRGQGYIVRADTNPKTVEQLHAPCTITPTQ